MKNRFGRSIILGGQGAVGQLFAELLRSEGEVTLVDLQLGAPRPGTSSIVVDACRPSPRLIAKLAEADIVVIALPEHVGAAAVEAVARHMPRGALLTETLSVKTAIAQALARAAQRYDLEALSVNPMFAPDLGFQGQSVVVAKVRGGERCRRLETLIDGHGGQLVSLSVQEHDRLTASLQVATHASILAFGWALQILDADIGVAVAAAPPPHRTLLALLARIVTGTREVYRDIQSAHPSAREVRQALLDALRHLEDVAMTQSPDRFDDMLEKIAAWLGPYREQLTCDCANIFERLAESHAEPPDQGPV
ncbi:MAG: prephenate dehydrogenase/arogenate dehydrogenase family protein [Pseudonocardiaceae bacterium]